MKTIFPTCDGRRALGCAVLFALAATTSVVAQAPSTITQTFNAEFPLAVSGPDSVVLSPTWNVQLWNGPWDLLGVETRLTVSISYLGTVVSPAADQTFEARIGGRFTLSNVPGAGGAGFELLPTLSANGTTGAAFTPTSIEGPAGAPLTDSEQGSLPAAIQSYLGSGTVPFVLSGTFLRTNADGAFSDVTDSGASSEAVFLNNPKVRSMEGLQAYGMSATLLVIYSVPESGVAGPVAGVLLPAGLYLFWRRHRRAVRQPRGEL